MRADRDCARAHVASGGRSCRLRLHDRLTGGRSPWSEATTLRTLCAPPGKLCARQRSPTLLRVWWQPPTGGASKYVVDAKPEGADESLFRRVYDGSAPRCSVRRMAASGESLELRVVAVNAEYRWGPGSCARLVVRSDVEP